MSGARPAILNGAFRNLLQRPALQQRAHTRGLLTSTRLSTRPITRTHGLRFTKCRSIRYNSSNPSPNPTSNLGSPESTPTLKQRMAKLSREYGWSALGVYLLLTALDFPFCFLAVRMLGTDRIGRWEHVIVDTFWKAVAVPFPSLARPKQAGDVIEDGALGDPIDSSLREIDEADKASQKSDATLWTQLVLAYAVHKSFIFIRVPLTVSLTPKVVKTLRGWGWDIGKRRPKPK